MDNKNVDEKVKLNRKEKKVYDVLIEYDFNIPNTDIGNILGMSQQRVSQIIISIKEKGYWVESKQPELTKMQRQVLELLIQYDYNISNADLANMMGKSTGSIYSILKALEEKGYPTQGDKPRLTKAQQEVYNLLLQYNYNISDTDLGRILSKRSESVSEIKRRIKEKGYPIEGDKPRLTKAQLEVNNLLIQYNYSISNTDIGKILGKTQEAVSDIIKHIKEKGYKTEGDKPKLTTYEREVLEVMKENDYDIPNDDIDEILGKSGRAKSTIDSLQKKGYLKESNKLRHAHLTKKEEELLLVNEQNDYKASYRMASGRIKVSPSVAVRLIKKFSKDLLDKEDAIRIAKYIKYKGKLDTLLESLENTEMIRHNNIKILIDELLKDENENKTNAIEFVIEYEKILLERGMKRVEEPLYQLLVKHKDKVKLTKRQCLKVADLIHIYEERIKEEDNISGENKEVKKEEVEGLEI